MATLDELLDIEGVVAAGEFTSDSHVLDFRTEIDMPPEMAQMMAQSLATIAMMFDNLDSSYRRSSGTQTIPRRGWAYSVGDWAIAIGGRKGVLVETAKADFNRLSEALVDSR